MERRHFKHIALNAAGVVMPMLVGMLVMPSLIQRLGTDRFGILSISWVLVGYFGLLDLGLSRGLTQYLSKLIASGALASERAALARQVRRWMLGMGVLWAALLLASMPWLTETGLRMPEALHSEAMRGWVFLALSVPLFMLASCNTGVLEAYSRFPALNAVRVPMGIATFVVPWGLAHWTHDLGVILAGLMLVRLVAALALAQLCRPYFAHPGNTPSAPYAANMRAILTYGGWLTLSNLVGPMLAYFDRFAIGALLSVTAVTYYAVPFDVLSRLPSLPLAMMGVLFPMLTRANHSPKNGNADLSRLIHTATRLLVTFWVPGLVVCGLLGEALLNWWVGSDIAQASATVWAWLAIGVLINGFAHIPYTLLHSAGRTDVTAKLHLSELLPYFLALWWALAHHGIEGAAAVWTFRVALDTLLLYASAARLFPTLRQACGVAFAWAIATSAALGIVQAVVSSRAVVWQPVFGIITLVAGALLWSAYHLRLMLKKPTKSL